MEITVNGEPRDVPAGATVAAVLEAFELAGRPVAVELNLQIVRRADFDVRRLEPGDRLEIVTLVGGG
jgi:thiamine biosynthesis protein ThiS